MNDDFYIRVLLETAEKTASAGQGARGTKTIATFVGTLPSASGDEAEYLSPFDQLPEPVGPDEVVEFAVARLLAAADAWRDQGATVDERLETLGHIPEPLQRRVIAEHLRRALPKDRSRAWKFLLGQVQHQRAFPEGLSLLRSFLELETDCDLKELVSCLGEPPSAVEVASWPRIEPLPNQWRRARSWLVAVPDNAHDGWDKAVLMLDQRYGTPRSDGRLMGDFESFSGPTSPFSVDELESLSPLTASEQIGRWRPDKDEDFGPTPRGLERTLQEVVEQDAVAWAEQPLKVIANLRHPTYIYGYFAGLKKQPSDVVGQSQDLAEAAIIVNAEPWPVATLHPDDFEADQDWHSASEAAIDLLGALASAGGDFGSLWPKITKLVYDIARQTEDSTRISGETVDALTAALNRGSTRALDVAFRLSEHEPRQGEELSAEFLEVLDHWLGLQDSSAVEGRALIAPRLPYLRYHNPAWFQRNQGRLIGDDAPGDYGQRTFALYLKWGRPRVDLLQEFASRYFEALHIERRAALQHLLHGFLWGVEPLADAMFVIKHIASEDPKAVSTSASILARLVSHAEDAALNKKAAEYWRAALDLHLDPDAYPGFGSFSDLTAIPEPEWRQLTLHTLELSRGRLSSASSVAERAEESASDPDSANIVLRILRGEPELWEAHQVARVAQELLREATGKAEEEPWQLLREFLLQRGYHSLVDLD